MSVTKPTTKQELASWQKWKAQAIKMEEWYEGRELPPGPIKINSCATIENVALYVSTNLQTMKASQVTVWMAAFKPSYMRLYHLKKYIENEQLRTVDGK